MLTCVFVVHMLPFILNDDVTHLIPVASCHAARCEMLGWRQFILNMTTYPAGWEKLKIGWFKVESGH